MFDPKRLLQYEFFPAELPPCFNSDDLAANAQHAIQAASKQNRAYSIPLTYSGYKSETARRKFAVPNPYGVLSPSEKMRFAKQIFNG